MSYKLIITIFTLLFSSIENSDNIILINGNESKYLKLEGSEIYVASEYYGRGKIYVYITSSDYIGSLILEYGSTNSMYNIPESFTDFSLDETFIRFDHEINVRYILKGNKSLNYGMVRISGLNNQYVDIRIEVYDDRPKDPDNSNNSHGPDLGIWINLVFLFPIFIILTFMVIVIIILCRKCKK